MPTDLEKEVKEVPYSEQELEYRGKLIKRLQQAYDARMQKWTEFNGVTYADYYESNAKAANSFLEEKQNEQEEQETSGITEEKGEAMLSALINHNLQPDIEAYDKDDNELQELGDVMQDAIIKSRTMERPRYEQKRVLILKEFLDQGTVF